MKDYSFWEDFNFFEWFARKLVNNLKQLTRKCLVFYKIIKFDII